MSRSLLNILAIASAFLAFDARTAVGADELQLPAKNYQWDPFKVGYIASWNINLGPYERDVPPNQPVRLGNIRAYFARDDFDAYLEQCEAGPKRKVVRRIRNKDERDGTLEIFEDPDRAIDLGFLSASALSLLPQIGQRAWPVAVADVLRGVLANTDYAQRIEKTRTSLSTLIAVGGRIEYEERAYRSTDAGRSWLLYRTIVYRVKVGEEDRSVPLYIQTVLCEIK
jgi:hypothetical protein